MTDVDKLNEEESYQEMVDYWKQALSSYIVSKGVFNELYAAADRDIEKLNWAIRDEAESIANSYHGSGEGIGTSDVNHFIQAIGKSLGIDDLFGWDKPRHVKENKMDNYEHNEKLLKLMEYTNYMMDEADVVSAEMPVVAEPEAGELGAGPAPTDQDHESFNYNAHKQRGEDSVNINVNATTMDGLHKMLELAGLDPSKADSVQIEPEAPAPQEPEAPVATDEQSELRNSLRSKLKKHMS